MVITRSLDVVLSQKKTTTGLFRWKWPDWASTPAAWISESSGDTEDLTSAGKEKRRNKERRNCFGREPIGSHRSHSHGSKPAALNRNLHASPGLFPQPGSRREEDVGSDNAINFHFAFAKYRKGHFKDF